MSNRDLLPTRYQKYLTGEPIGSEFAPHSSQAEVRLAFPLPEWLTDGGEGGIPGEAGGETDVLPFTKVIERLSPEHRHIIETLIRELAKIEGIEVPTTTAGESQPEPIGKYIPAWQNSLGNESYSEGSIDLYSRNLKLFFAAVEPPYTTIAIEAYIASRREKHKSPNTIKNDLKAIKSFFGFLYERDIIASDPTAKLKHPKIIKEEKVCPTPGEMAKFLAVLATAKNLRAKLMMSIFINTGIRFDELVTLNWGKINLEQREISVLGKGRKWRTVPISSPLRDFLAELRNEHDDSELLFPTKSKKGKWDNSDANKMIARLCRRAKIKRYTCHQFRHYFATHTLKGTGEKGLKSVQKMLGHASAATTLDYYIHTDEEEIRKTHEAFAPLSGGKGPKEDKGGSNRGKTN